jgi:uncharacterized membrane protein
MAAQNKNLSRDQIRRLTITGMLTAIIILLAFTNLGLIPIGTISITTIHLPVLIGLLAEGPLVGFILAFVFGACSLLRALISPSGPFDVFFLNPMISILPRLLIPLAAWGMYRLIKALLPNKKSADSVAWAAAGLTGSLTNTVLVLLSIYVWYGGRVAEWIAQNPDLAQYANAAGKFLFFAVALPNGIPEAIVTLILIPAIMAAVMAIKKRR